MNLLSVGWLWLYLGAFLMLAELVTPGFVVFFFGLAAASVGALVLVLPDPFELHAMGQLALFSFFSVLYFVTLRRMVKGRLLGNGNAREALEDPLVGRVGKVVEAIRKDVPGRVLVGDAQWTASAGADLPEGATVKVVARKNLTLCVIPL
jgi:membrane protein implicated in regulation of membrane protease activity